MPRSRSPREESRTASIAELFAGVGGFRVGFQAASDGFRTVFSSQWEPPGTVGKQFASRCYESHFGSEGHSNADISAVLDGVESLSRDMAPIDVLVGGFPCQDYSVAKPLNQSDGLVGKKGVLWWQIHRLIKLQQRNGSGPDWLVLENVDRLLQSPASQRGRDFAIMLASLSDLGYDVEWRVINAAHYGFPQKRRRVFIVGRRRTSAEIDAADVIYRTGVLARALPIKRSQTLDPLTEPHFELRGDLAEITKSFGHGNARSGFLGAGFMRARRVWTVSVEANYRGASKTLGDILQPLDEVPEEFLVEGGSIAKWRYAKGSKHEPRVNKRTGATYFYTEGALPFPDPLDRPARTILTSEGGATATRSKHIICQDGVFRRLTPIELERLNGFDDHWTDTGMSDAQRAFCMGNALVVGVVERIARRVAKEIGLKLKKKRAMKKRAKRRVAKAAAR